MRAIVCPRFGGPEVLRLDEMADPSPCPGELLVETRACSVTFADLLMIQGRYQVKPDLPFVPGTEVAGIVREVGPGVDEFNPGDPVLGRTVRFGGMAEMATLHSRHAFVVPDTAELTATAGSIYAYGTALYALRDRAGLQPGETLVVLGAAGAVGLAAVEVGQLLGARVLAAASSNEKLELCQRYGAAGTINYSREDLKTRIRELTAGEGADVVYDPVGGSYSEPAVRSMAWNGRYVVIGFAAGDIPRIPLNLPLLRGCSIVGVDWGAFLGRQPEQFRANTADMVSCWAAGKLNPQTPARYPMEKAADAMRALAERRVVGKVVVTP